jgi:hypothetical protein
MPGPSVKVVFRFGNSHAFSVRDCRLDRNELPISLISLRRCRRLGIQLAIYDMRFLPPVFFAGLSLAAAGALLTPVHLPAQQSLSPGSRSPHPATVLTAASDPQVKNAPNGTATQPDPDTAAQDATLYQTKRILGIVPNFRSVPSTDVLPPQTPREKFLGATTTPSTTHRHSFPPRSRATVWSRAPTSSSPTA